MLSSNRIPFSQRSVLRGLRQNIGRIDNDFVRIIVNGGRNPKKRLMGTLKSTTFGAKTACAIVPTLTLVPSFVAMPRMLLGGRNPTRLLRLDSKATSQVLAAHFQHRRFQS
jgi:hypothetical protein